MANDNICVFCGEKIGFFNAYTICCADIRHPCCKNCADELQDTREDELCRRALRLGLAEQPEKLEERLDLLTESEAHRPACLRCGAKLKFGKLQHLDNTPTRDSIFSDIFYAQPAYCRSCGKIELYHPDYVATSKYLAFLIKQDSDSEY